MSETDNRTASQRIEDLEKVVSVIYQTVSQHDSNFQKLSNILSDMTLVKDAVKLLNKKLEAIVQVADPSTGITVESVSAFVLKINVEDLKAQVQSYLSNGFLEATEEVDSDSYLVCEEIAADGTIANPRVQFRLDSQDETTQGILKGKKAGDVVSFGEEKLSAKVLEIYKLVTPKPPEAAAPAADESALEAVPAETEAAPSESATA